MDKPAKIFKKQNFHTFTLNDDDELRFQRVLQHQYMPQSIKNIFLLGLEKSEKICLVLDQNQSTINS